MRTGWTGWILDIYISNYESQNPKQAIPIMNFFFYLSINEILKRLFVFDSHRTLFPVHGHLLYAPGHDGSKIQKMY